jgi:hypothetical protein
MKQTYKDMFIWVNQSVWRRLVFFLPQMKIARRSDTDYCPALA